MLMNAPSCGTSSIRRVRRITGYLSTVDRFKRRQIRRTETAGYPHGKIIGIRGIRRWNLRIAGTQRESVVDGPGLRFVIFTQGCPHRCPGCHNPNTHDPRGRRTRKYRALASPDKPDQADPGRYLFPGASPSCRPRRSPLSRSRSDSESSIS